MKKHEYKEVQQNDKMSICCVEKLRLNVKM